MTQTGGPCPGTHDIELLASGGETSAPIALHVESCPLCRQRLESALDEARFLNRFRTAARPNLAPEGAPRVPGYRVLGVISTGAQGVVYKATQESTSRTVAIKTLPPGHSSTARQRSRAEREAEIAARLRHPNIVTVFEARTLSDGRIAVVMEFIDGVSLDEWKPPGDSDIARRREFLRAFASICAAVHHAHLNGVIHRDLKPDNILVTRESRPVVLDFGIAKAGGIRTTRTGEFAGTPAYASPEQVSLREKEVDALTDVYSLGVILYRLTCGAMPYHLEGSILDMARTIEEIDPIPPRQCDPLIPPDLEAIILRALRKDRHGRYQSAAAFARDIERFLSGEPVEARSNSGLYLLRKAVFMNRKRLGWAAAAVLLVAGAAAAVVTSMIGAAHQREQAHAESVRARAVTELLRETLPNADPSRPDLGNVVGAGLSRLYFRLETGTFRDDPEVDQAIRRLWGSVYTGFAGGKAAGLVEYSEVSLRNGLERLRIRYGAEHPEIADTMHELAGVLLVRKRPAEAEQFSRDALAMREKLVGRASIEANKSRALLARAIFAQARAPEAVRLADDAIAHCTNPPGPEDDLIVASMTALKARAALDARSLDSCEPLLREALVRRLRRLPPEDPDLAASLVDAADLAPLLPECALVRTLCDAWGTIPSNLPTDIRRDLPLIAVSELRGTPAKSIVRSDRTDALARLLRLADALLKPDDPAIVGILVAQIRVAREDEQPLVRADAAMRAADILAKRYGPGDESILVCVEEASIMYAMLGQTQRALELGRRAISIRESVPESARDPLLTANLYRYQGLYLALHGDYAEAIPIHRQALADLARAVGERHHVYALTQSTYAYCLFESGDRAQGDELSARALELAESLAATAPDQLSLIRFARGHILTRLGRFAEARTQLERSSEGYFQYLPSTFPWKTSMLEDLTLSCDRLGDSAAAATWRTRLAVPAPPAAGGE